MSHTRAHEWAGRGLSLAASTLLGLSLVFVCLRAASASAQTPAAPAADLIFRVNNNFKDGLAGYWKFDQVSGTTTINSLPLELLTTLSNGASLTTNVPPSLTVPNFDALQLDGVNDVAVVADDPALDVPTTTFSIAAWVRRVVTGTSTADLIYDSGTQPGHWFFGFLSNNKLTFTTNGLVDYSSPFTVTDGNWHHVAAVVNGAGPGNLSIYLDGVAALPITATVTNTPSGTKLIGNKTIDFDTPFSGDIDDLRLYNRALTASQVQLLASGSGCVTAGDTWVSPFTDLQCALAVAGPGDEIWVAKTLTPYRPGTNRGASFNLSSQAALFGGFQGSEQARIQRPPIDFDFAVQTRLSGDLFGDDPVNFNQDDNAFHVVNGGPAGPGTVLDGVRIESGVADGPSTASEGGGLFAPNAGLAIANSDFALNSAGQGGGGIYANAGLRLDNVTFFGNHAHFAGGAQIVGSAVITAGSFLFNTSDSACGGLEGDGPLVISGTQFSNNRAGNVGGGACSFGQAQLAGARFSQNQASANGGGYVAEGALTVSNSQFISNTTLRNGGGLASLAPVTVSAVLFSGNTATGTDGIGGGVVAFNRIQMDGSSFVGNAAAQGGGIAVLGPSSRIFASAFLANRAVLTNGGGLMLSIGELTLADSLLVGNQANVQGAALENAGGVLTVSNVTADQNQAGSPFGGVFFQNGGASSVANSILQRSQPGDIAAIGAFSVSFSLAGEILPGPGNISATAHFVRDPNPGDGNWATLADNDYGDLHLQLTSPGIDAGNNDLVPAGVELDLDGQPRFVDVPFVPDTGAGTPPIVDVGAYEAEALQLFLPLIER